AAPGGQRRIHPRRLHRRRTGRHGHLPERDHPTHHRPPEGHLRGRLPRLPAAATVHHPQARSIPIAAPPRRAAAPGPPRLDQPRGPARGLPPISAHGRTLHRLAHRPAKPLPATALPRHRRQRPLATPPHRRAQPPPPAQPRPHPPHRRLGSRLSGPHPDRPCQPPAYAQPPAGKTNLNSYPATCCDPTCRKTDIEQPSPPQTNGLPQETRLFRSLLEDRIRRGKDTGFGRFPSRVFAINQAWLELALTGIDLLAWTQHLLLDGELAHAEPKKLALPAAARRCPDHPYQPANPPAHRRNLARGGRSRRRVRTPHRAATTHRLTRHPDPT